jgi:hypothetical protein
MSEPQLLSPEAVAVALLGNGSAPTAPAVEPVPPVTALPPAENAGGSEPLRDSLGRVFDAKRFRTNPDGSPFLDKNGRYMPRGGRKPKDASGAVGVAENRETTAPQPLPAPPSGPAWTAEERATAEKPLQPVGDAAAKLVEPEVVGSADDTAEVACQALYTVLGLATDAPEEAEPSGPQHKRMLAVTAAYLRARGWVFVGGFAVCVALLAFLLTVARKPKTREAVRRWLGKAKPPAAPKPPEQPPAPAPEPAQAKPPATPARFPTTNGPSGNF